MATKPAAPESLLEFLREQVQEAVAGLAGVGRKKMLVSVGWAVKDRTFALVSRQGRVVVRLPDARAEEELLAIDGAERWKFGTRAPPRGWVQLPEAMQDDREALRGWLRRAWELNGREAAPRTKKKKKVARRTR
jgi:TfoX/Sxy family transcriptional regulator of competence genes